MTAFNLRAQGETKAEKDHEILPKRWALPGCPAQRLFHNNLSLKMAGFVIGKWKMPFVSSLSSAALARWTGSVNIGM